MPRQATGSRQLSRDAISSSRSRALLESWSSTSVDTSISRSPRTLARRPANDEAHARRALKRPPPSPMPTDDEKLKTGFDSSPPDGDDDPYAAPTKVGRVPDQVLSDLLEAAPRADAERSPHDEPPT